MSTLKVNTVQHNTSGFNNVVQFTDGAGTQNGTLCRAWVNFNGIGAVAIRASFNVSSITDNSQGRFDVNFSNSMPDANYAMGFHLQEDSGGGLRVCAGYNTRSSSYMRLETRTSSNSLVDMEWNTVCFFR